MVFQGPGYLKSRDAFMEALADHIDARIDYRAAEPEWCSSREMAASCDRLEKALDALLRHE